MSSDQDVILEGRGAYEKYKAVKEQGLLLFECVVGSQAYGTNIVTSDVDKKFVYLETLDNILAGDVSQQINVTDDYVGYELGRYLGLLRTQNPNIIELINSDEKHIEYCHPMFRELIMSRRDEFLTRKVAFSFGEYARSQIKKAQGTNKKFLNPEPEKRKDLMEFCWIGYQQGSIMLRDWLELRGLSEADGVPSWLFGAVGIEHMKNTYHLFFDRESYDTYRFNEDEMVRDYVWAHRKYNGIISSDGVNLRTVSVEKGEEPIVTFYCNMEGFQTHCKRHGEYWGWVEKRNIHRFVKNSEPGMNYDRKNMMHCHRLLDMCIEILSGEGVKVYRPNREELLGIRNGNSTYQELVDLADAKYAQIQSLHETSMLQNECPREFMHYVLLEFRKKFFKIN